MLNSSDSRRLTSVGGLGPGRTWVSAEQSVAALKALLIGFAFATAGFESAGVAHASGFGCGCDPSRDGVFFAFGIGIVSALQCIIGIVARKRPRPLWLAIAIVDGIAMAYLYRDRVIELSSGLALVALAVLATILGRDEPTGDSAP